MFYKVLNAPVLWKFVIFVIKPNPICANNNPKLQKPLQKVRGSTKTKGIIYCCQQLQLRFARVPRSVSAELRSHNIVLAFTRNKPGRKIRRCDRSKRLTDTRYGELKEILNIILNKVIRNIVFPFLMTLS